MKGERRQMLRHMVLADWIAGVVTQIDPDKNLIVGPVLMAIAAIFVYSWWSRDSAAETAVAWNEFYKARATGNPADFDKVTELFPDSHVSHWAAVVAGDAYLAQGCNQLFSSKSTANHDLRKAVDSFLIVLKGSRESMLRERATFGMARAKEALGDLKEATDNYQKVTADWPQGAYTATAQRRLEDLKDPKTKAFYDKSAKYDPKPAFTDEPGMPGERPAFDLDSLPSDAPAATPSDFMDLKETAPGGKKPGE